MKPNCLVKFCLEAFVLLQLQDGHNGTSTKMKIRSFNTAITYEKCAQIPPHSFSQSNKHTMFHNLCSRDKMSIPFASCQNVNMSGVALKFVIGQSNVVLTSTKTDYVFLIKAGILSACTIQLLCNSIQTLCLKQLMEIMVLQSFFCHIQIPFQKLTLDL